MSFKTNVDFPSRHHMNWFIYFKVVFLSSFEQQLARLSVSFKMSLLHFEAENMKFCKY